jgi:hypothetical protein
MVFGALLFFAGPACADAEIDLVDTEGPPGAVVPLDARLVIGDTGELTRRNAERHCVSRQRADCREMERGRGDRAA